jgi:hypothetical protein
LEFNFGKWTFTLEGCRERQQPEWPLAIMSSKLRPVNAFVKLGWPEMRLCLVQEGTRCQVVRRGTKWLRPAFNRLKWPESRLK